MPNYRGDITPGATRWGFVVFPSDEPVEVAIAAGGSVQSLRGRFDGRRFGEYSWRNGSDETWQVAIRAKALAGERELPATRIQFHSQQNVFVGFGRPAMPVERENRRGGYPYEAVFVGFIVFET